MSIVEAVIAAQREMPPLVYDEKARMGSYSFAYATLAGILKAVMPPLLAHGVMLRQDVTSENGVVCVESTLISTEGENIRSGKLSLPFDGTPIDAAKKVTSMRRMQLLGLLGMAADEEEQALYRQPEGEVSFPNASERKSTPIPDTSHKLTAAQIAQRQHAAAEGKDLKLREEIPYDNFILTIRNMDANDNTPMPVTIREGAKASMYGYLCGLVDQSIGVANAHQTLLSYLFGRVVSSEAPPKLGHRYLIDELREHPKHPHLKEAYDFYTTWEG